MQQTQLPTNLKNQTVDEADTEAETLSIKESEFKYGTPLQLFKPISDAVGGFDLDPCASAESQLAVTNVRQSGGLAYDWGQHERVWVNYDFGESEKWIKKCAETDADLVVALCRLDASTEYFHKYQSQADLHGFLDDRVQFVGFNDNPDFSIVISVWGDYPAELRDTLADLGTVVDGSAWGQAEASNQLLVQNEPEERHDVLPAVSRADSLHLTLDEWTDHPKLDTTCLEVIPLTRQVVEQPSPWAGPEDTQTPPAQAGASKEEYLELTCIHPHEDGTESFVVLAQSLRNPRQVYCYIHDGCGFQPHSLARVSVPTDQRETAPPSSAMSVP